MKFVVSLCVYEDKRKPFGLKETKTRILRTKWLRLRNNSMLKTINSQRRGACTLRPRGQCSAGSPRALRGWLVWRIRASLILRGQRILSACYALDTMLLRHNRRFSLKIGYWPLCRSGARPSLKCCAFCIDMLASWACPRKDTKIGGWV